MAAPAPIDAEANSDAEGAAPQPWPEPAAAWGTLAVLSVVLALSQIDRGVITLLVGPIKRDLRLTDSQVGLLIGLAFSLVYLFTSLPLSRLSDSRSRKWMITAGVSFWSLATAACGLAHSYWQMFAARAAVGVGESVNGPATYSLLADNFPRQKLTRAMAMLNLGFIVGVAFSLIVGGMMLAILEALPPVVLPGLGHVRNWQLVFFAVGLPGLLVALAMAFVPEPVRRGLHVAARSPAVPLGEVLAFLRGNIGLYGPIFVGVFLVGVETYGVQNWRPTFFERTYHWKLAFIGQVTGWLSLVASLIGLFLGAALTEWLSRQRDDANLIIAVSAQSLSIPFAVAGPLMPNGWLALACSSVGLVTAMVSAPPMVAAMQTVTPNRMRAQISSLYLIMFSGITAIIGPSFLAAVTDFVFHDDAKLRYAMAASSAIMLPLGVLMNWLAVRPYGRLIAAIKAQEAQAARLAP